MSGIGRFDGKIWILTGSTGMAGATAELAAAQGARLFITSRTASHGEELVAKIRRTGGVCEFVAADLKDPRTGPSIVEQCVARYGRVDALFNVAGISGRKFGDGPIHECSEEGWDMTLDTNVRSMFLMC